MILVCVCIMLEFGCCYGFLKFDDVEDVYQVFYGLVICDVYVCFLFGEVVSFEEQDLKFQVKMVVDWFYRLFGV